MQQKFEKHIDVKQSQTILDCLSVNTEFSRQQLKKILLNGAVWIENSQGINRIRRVKKILHQGNKVHFYYDAAVQAAYPAAAQLIADEGDYSIWNKPCGMYSQGSKWGDHCTIYRWAEQHLIPQRPAFIVHRLDKAANGLIIIAHKKSVAAKFSTMFARHEIFKKYSAVIEGIMTIADLTCTRLPFEISTIVDNKIAISEIFSLNADLSENITIVEISIKTGRKHQIRQQLSGLGYPIVGDRLYAAKNTESDLQLSSIELKFICPLSSKAMLYNLTQSKDN